MNDVEGKKRVDYLTNEHCKKNEQKRGRKR